MPFEKVIAMIRTAAMHFLRWVGILPPALHPVIQSMVNTRRFRLIKNKKYHTVFSHHARPDLQFQLMGVLTASVANNDYGLRVFLRVYKAMGSDDLDTLWLWRWSFGDNDKEDNLFGGAHQSPSPFVIGAMEGAYLKLEQSTTMMTTLHTSLQRVFLESLKSKDDPTIQEKSGGETAER